MTKQTIVIQTVLDSMADVIVLLGTAAVLFAGAALAGQPFGKRYTHAGEEFIINGADATVNEYPWHVIILRHGQYQCGGTILNRRHILTAAHCVELCYSATADYSVLAGDYDLSTASGLEQVIQAKAIFIHPNYDYYNLKHDIAIIKLRQRLNYTAGVQPVTLSDGVFNSEAETSSDCWSTGYGLTGQSPDQYKTILQELNTNVITNAECDSLLAAWGLSVITKMVCVNDSNKSGCFGDSGGPLGCYDTNNVYRQVGITSWMASYDCLVGPKVFTRVSKYLKWINGII